MVFFQDDIGSVITDVSSISGDPGHIEMHEDTPLASGIDPLVNRCTLCIIRPTMNNFYSHKLCILTQDKYNMYTNYKVHVLKQNIFPNQETFTVITLINLHNFSTTTML